VFSLTFCDDADKGNAGGEFLWDKAGVSRFVIRALESFFGRRSKLARPLHIIPHTNLILASSAGLFVLFYSQRGEAAPSKHERGKILARQGMKSHSLEPSLLDFLVGWESLLDRLRSL
jgi:hypothetical protein